MTIKDSITISTNYWRVPSPERAFGGWLEGVPTPEERLTVIEAAKAARASWKPNSDAMLLVEQMKSFIGHRVEIQFWDTCMWLLEEEGPYPCQADCVGVIIQQDGDFPQAYLQVIKVTDLPTRDGYSPEPYFEQRADCNYLHAPFADIYTVKKVAPSAKP